MNKFKSHWWSILSILLIVLSSFPLQTIAENLQPSEEPFVKNLQLTDLEGKALPQEVEPDASIVAQFDLVIGENEEGTYGLPAEITTNDQKLYQHEDVTVLIEDNQLKITNESNQQASVEGVSFDFKLADQVRSQSQVTLNFLNVYDFNLALKQEQPTKETTSKKSTAKKKTSESSQTTVTPFQIS